MADSDDIDKLLREIDAMSNPSAARPAVPASQASPPATQPTPSGGANRGAWAAAGATGGLLVGGLTGALLPFIGSVQMGLGAALGGAVVGFLSHPPEWFSRD